MMTKNVRIMLALLVIALLYTFVLGCDDTVTVHDDGVVTGADTLLEDMVLAPVLDPLDDAVGSLRDAEEAILLELVGTD